ncbi:protein-L-isoaspartate(D-aspartate) O-methyltransferase [Saliniramus fredricksonii]|uniref:Protein-L-isoaspartate O-methyltransferase n=2 Tax=Saliniramus fredricksonii TaxID=1653334 RepID=A0ABY0KD80_9HYPH|nr:protein-L-isoaspartate(D-aspartate) O-methyltransferase [Saliniramus fredricksonii]
MQIARGRSSGAGGESMAAKREYMVSRQIAARGVSDPNVREAMLAVPREVFVPAELAEFAYEDTPLPIGADQTISQPYIVAMMLEAAEIAPGEKVLDVGTGSGYAAALASRIAGKVVSIERHAELTEAARKAIDTLGYDNIDLRIGDGTQGAADEAPFDVILVAAGGPEIPEILIEQLSPGGRMIIPVGPVHRYQHLLRIRKTGDNRIKQEDLGPVAFVPLIGVGGWRDPACEEIVHPTEGKGTSRAVGGAAARAVQMGAPNAPTDPAALIARHAEPLPEIGASGFGAMFDRIRDARVVAIGEATHGTSEFYRARAAITRHLRAGSKSS